MGKMRGNIYFDDSTRQKLRDIQYVYTKTRKLKKSISFSEIINKLLNNLSVEKIMQILNKK